MRAVLLYAVCFNVAVFAGAGLAALAGGPGAGAATLGFALGAAVGSYANLVGYRVRAGVPVSGPPNHCPLCGAAIRPWHNVPVLGWVALGGRCAECRGRIPFAHPAVEAAAGAVGAAVGWWAASAPLAGW